MREIITTETQRHRESTEKTLDTALETMKNIRRIVKSAGEFLRTREMSEEFLVCDVDRF